MNRLVAAFAHEAPGYPQHEEHEADETGDLKIQRIVGAVFAGERVIHGTDDPDAIDQFRQRAGLRRDRRSGDHRLERFGEVMGGEAFAMDLTEDFSLGVNQGDLVQVVEAGGGGDIAEAEILRQFVDDGGCGTEEFPVGQVDAVLGRECFHRLR